MVHLFGDSLCYKWNRNAPINEGFSLSRITPLPGYVEEDLFAATEEEFVEGYDAVTEGNESSVQESAVVVENDPIIDDEHIKLDEQVEVPAIASDGFQDGPPCELSENIIQSLEEISLKVSCTVCTEEEPLACMNEREMNLFLEICLLRALYYIVKDKHLPCLISNFWSILLRYCYAGI